MNRLSFYAFSTRAHAVIGVVLALVTIGATGAVIADSSITTAQLLMYAAAALNVINVSIAVAGRRASNEEAAS